MTNTFISYSRKDTEYTHEIVDAIKARGLDAWVDWEGIPPTVDWMEQIQKGIAEADTFLFLLSPDSAASKVCADELEYAAKNGKRIIPIVLRDVKPDEAPVQTRHLNWIFFRKDKEDFEAALDKLVTAINTDYGWVQAHRRLQVKALEWEKHSREGGYLLRGHDLQDAEAQHAMNSSKQPEPTDLQREYVFASRKAVERQRRILTIASIVVAIALLGLGIFASIKAVEATRQAVIAQKNAEEALAQKAEAEKQRNEAETQRQLAVENATLARAGELSARSTILRNSNFQLSMLLGLEANNLVDNTETRSALLDNAQAHPQLLQYFNNAPGAVYAIAYSPDGKTFASGNEQGDILLWDAVSHEPIGQPFHANTKGITDLAFSPDGSILATASFDGSVTLWNTANGEIIRQLIKKYALYDYITSVAFSPDGTILATGRGDESFVNRWDIETGQVIGESLTVDAGVNDLAFSPDGAMLAAANGDHVTLFNPASGSSLKSPPGNAYDSIYQVAFNTDGTVLAAGSYNHTIFLWDTASGANTAQWSTGQSSGVEDAITGIAISPDGSLIASSNNAGTLFLWDAISHAQIGEPLGGASSGEILSIAFHPDGTSITSADRAGNIILWDVKPRLANARRLSGHTEAVTTVAFNPEGTILASGSYDHGILLWDTATGEALAESLNGHTDRVTDLVFSPDGKQLASAGCRTMARFTCVEGEILLWDVATRQLIGEPRTAHTNYVSALAFSPDGSILASASYDQSVILWDAVTGEPLGDPLLAHGNVIIGLTFNRDGKLLASWDTQNTIILWDVATGKPVQKDLLGFGVDFSPDGKAFAAARKSNTIIFWDVETLEESTQMLVGLNNAFGRVQYSPDGKTIASNNAFNPMLWQEGNPLGQPFTGHTSYLTDFTFSPDGSLLASASYDKSIILWNLNQQSWIESACQRTGRNLSLVEWSTYFGDEPYHVTCSQWPAGQ